MQNRLYEAENQSVLRELPEKSVDLVYLDPLFDTGNRHFPAATQEDGPAGRQEGFLDTWSMDEVARNPLRTYRDAYNQTDRQVQAFMRVLARFQSLGYVCMMAGCLAEVYRLLKDTGSLYLHCSPRISWSLRLLCNGLFGQENLRCEIVWKRTSVHNSARRWGRIHDTILFYSKTDDYT